MNCILVVINVFEMSHMSLPLFLPSLASRTGESGGDGLWFSSRRARNRNKELSIPDTYECFGPES